MGAACCSSAEYKVALVDIKKQPQIETHRKCDSLRVAHVFFSTRTYHVPCACAKGVCRISAVTSQIPGGRLRTLELRCSAYASNLYATMRSSCMTAVQVRR